ncbi:PQQ-dependent sugar dehydrogenase [Panacibacter sp. DH6]|uniref:PQQ-dependent sugar dehydrogenase n=2 Tax=Panacibacter microcysteis TaxID=2793269 RepID=A0A931H074_9BACT|nr:PQQ-dependent sugar dehydrogenase [Panacibacter microcysteis]
MLKTLPVLILSCLLMICFNACQPASAFDDKTIAHDTASISAGESVFNQRCEGCHNFRQDGIGPQLNAVTKEVTTQWLTDFIKDPQAMISHGDERAGKLYARYKVSMPSFGSLTDNDIHHIIAFLNTHTATVTAEDADAVKDPVPSKIPKSALTANLQFIAQLPASADSGKKPLARITQMIVQPGSNKLFVLDLRGNLYQLTGNTSSVFMNMKQLKPGFIAEPGLGSGFGSIAFHPAFMRNGLFYTTHTEKTGSAIADFGYADSIKVSLQWVLTEWKANDVNDRTFKGTSRELLRINMVSVIHGMQEIAFNPFAKKGDEDYGLLYGGIGDGGCTENGFLLAHNKANLWGTVIRIDPSGSNSRNRRYGIPATNPFVHTPGAAPEIFAMGFRNPHRITWLAGGAMLVSNVGQANIESVNMVTAGSDFGWPLREGNFVIHDTGNINKVYALPADDSAMHITYPVIEYDHDEGKAISGGYAYKGPIAALKNKFLFGDIPTGRLFFTNIFNIKQGSIAPLQEWSVAIDGKTASLQTLCGNDRVDLHFGTDANNDLYIMTKADGKIYRIVSAAE